MDLRLTRDELDLQSRAREFAEKHLFPHEVECDENEGLSPDSLKKIRKAVLDYGLNGFNHTKGDGGQGFTHFQQILLHEELGKATNGLWTQVWTASLPLKHGTPEQREKYLLPIKAGKGRACYAITEPGAGSDPRMVQTSAVKRNGKYVLAGEKWFVTSANASTIILVHAHVDGDPDKPTLFIVDRDQPGVIKKRVPRFMHTYAYEHWEIVFDKVELDESRILGQ